MRAALRYSGVAVLAVALAFGGVFVFGGFWDISATRQHPLWIYRGLVLVRDTLVSFEAAGVDVPAEFEPVADAKGAALYQVHCAQCHGGPGVAPADFALGMMPVPPPLVHSARERPPEEIYWFIHDGLKMSGMPAWSMRMSETEMWRITAFVEALPTLTPAAYRELVPQDETAPPSEGTLAEVGGIPDAERGRLAMQLYACRSCHEIPGLVGARPLMVGPPLEEAASRRYIAGVLPNTTENMMRWIMDPHEVDPLSVMPDLGVSAADARDMTAYLYTLSPPYDDGTDEVAAADAD
ncbi:c-type cytochrome [Tranquillimonas alkanivorans]|uniref:Cytochrome C oxidase, cbb3-type, subunit III n=1 Tax=Tranquillimonas alkanivorans TaxID=441119 RepID=A0A1I5VLN8_9RHOB|nr:c-type cytochrome [Tranquillimonas alkanivorans]SFQ08363.1 Cytochrome C oxidase, cbb3-type, subunit III [Tranquillimonas alkanivorans]